MQTNEFEQAFSNFLETKEYDDAEDTLFSVIRMAFIAGWKAARGEAPEPQDKVICLLYQKRDDRDGMPRHFGAAFPLYKKTELC